jgi:hypothetical protein
MLDQVLLVTRAIISREVSLRDTLSSDSSSRSPRYRTELRLPQAS